MLCRAGRVPTGGARSPVGTGAVEAGERVAAAAMGAVGATNVTVVAEAGVGSENPKGRRRGDASLP